MLRSATTKNSNSNINVNIINENRYIDYSSYQDPRRRNETVIESDDLQSSTELDISTAYRHMLFSLG